MGWNVGRNVAVGTIHIPQRNGFKTMSSFLMNETIYARIVGATDINATCELFADAYGCDTKEVISAYETMLVAAEQAGLVVTLKDGLTKYSIPKTIEAWAKKADKAGCILRLNVKDGVTTIVVDNPNEKMKGKKNSKRRYFVDGVPLFDKYPSIMKAMRALGGFETVIKAVGPGNAHKVDADKYSAKTSLNSWQALQSFGTTAQKTRITRTG